MSIVLNMSRSDYEKILAHCREGLPNESCGLLAYDTSIEYLILSLQEENNPVLKAFGIDKEKNVTVHEIVYHD